MTHLSDRVLDAVHAVSHRLSAVLHRPTRASMGQVHLARGFRLLFNGDRGCECLPDAVYQETGRFGVVERHGEGGSGEFVRAASDSWSVGGEGSFAELRPTGGLA